MVSCWATVGASPLQKIGACCRSKDKCSGWAHMEPQCDSRQSNTNLILAAGDMGRTWGTLCTVHVLGLLVSFACPSRAETAVPGWREEQLYHRMLGCPSQCHQRSSTKSTFIPCFSLFHVQPVKGLPLLLCSIPYSCTVLPQHRICMADNDFLQE